ncbi:hypothetical protein [uncultured Alistipes sp.]|jgi:lipoprotein|uniref:hypothetical protein n=1 Tax=uncultured Alistipes sp. TaxID=538949 RepID=UPI0025DD18FC|nr:hypothetical protein [uncultured Alistipes sp.]
MTKTFISLIKYTAAACVLTATAWSCSEGESPSKNPGNDELLTITAHQEPIPESRMVYIPGANDKTDPLATEWTSDDAFAVFGSGAPTKFTNAIPSGTSAPTADFTGTLPEGNQPYRAFYPFAKAASTWAACMLDVTGQTQNGLNDMSHFAAYDYRTGSVTLAGGDPPYTANVGFKKEMAIFKLELLLPYDMFDRGVPTSVELSTTDNSFYTVKSLTGNEAPNASSVSLAFTGMDSYQSSYSFWAYFMIIPTNLAGKDMTVRVRLSNGYSYRITRRVNLNFEARKHYSAVLSDKDSTTVWIEEHN